MSGGGQRQTLWALLCVCTALCGLAGPFLALGGNGGSEMRPLLWAFPAYTCASAVCAWMCRQQRKEVAWILVAMAVLATGAIIAVSAIEPTRLFIEQ